MDANGLCTPESLFILFCDYFSSFFFSSNSFLTQLFEDIVHGALQWSKGGIFYIKKVGVVRVNLQSGIAQKPTHQLI